MSIPGKVLVAVLAALAVSALTPMFLAQLQFQLLIGPTAAAALLAVLLSHRAIPMPASLAGEARSAGAQGQPSRGSSAASNSASGQRAQSSSRKRKGDSGRQKQEAKNPARPRGASETGTVKWFNSSKGFGFIVRENGDEIFVHHRSIKGEGRQSLSDGSAVRFVVVTTDKGPQAEDVEQVG